MDKEYVEKIKNKINSFGWIKVEVFRIDNDETKCGCCLIGAIYAVEKDINDLSEICDETGIPNNEQEIYEFVEDNFGTDETIQYLIGNEEPPFVLEGGPIWSINDSCKTKEELFEKLDEAVK